MKRRDFLFSLSGIPFIGKFLEAKPLPSAGEATPVCELCRKYGHQAEYGELRSRDWVETATASVRWCPNAPVDWTFYERVVDSRHE